MYKISKTNSAKISQSLLCDGLMALMEKKSYNDITIKRLCEKSDVSRKTFYRNFDKKDDIIELIIDNIYTETDPLQNTQNETYESILETFNLWDRHRNFLILLEKNNLLSFIQKKFVEQSNYFNVIDSEDPLVQIYGNNFLASGVFAILDLWIKRKFQETPEDLATISLNLSLTETAL